MHSCLYEGAVAHHRRDPVTHRFRYGLVMAYLDLEELPQLVGRGNLLSDSRYGLASFRASDRLFDDSQTLDTQVRELCAQRSGNRPTGPIRVLTQLRWYGYYFSPLNLYFAFDPAGEQVEQVLAEVNNTPWGERHAYVLCDRNRTTAGQLRFEHAKDFHVSPFMSMEGDYRWRLTPPGEHLTVCLSRRLPAERSFDAGLTLRRKPLTAANLRWALVRYPAMTAQVTAAIYYQALKLWWKQCPYYPHPQRSRTSRSSEQQPTTPIKPPVNDRDASRQRGATSSISG
ncbi:DUF1365 domain-containing protein [Aeoliella sp. ICT_H6.2]|uniref:DUF1365 domain-containing protein n=1 Tax=Aeoliella straminimaris TaxID=2954799 RepID=A0A9X2JH17_9BACT|nr:DUF1365 domain-containing protein [Aeoliella straminimaris]MCO6042449.1 DUF1365 domain-containing protein [Aeoliella straminimaris]